MPAQHIPRRAPGNLPALVSLSELGIRPAVMLGFAVTIATWVLAYFYFSQRIEVLERRQLQLSGHYEASQNLLTLVRSEMLASSVAARDAMTETNPADVAAHMRRNDRAKAAVRSSMSEYALIFPGDAALNTPRQRSELALLQRNINAFDARVQTLLTDDRPISPAGVSGILNREIGPSRETAMDVAGSLLRMNREGFLGEQARVAARYKSAQQGLLGALGFALVTSLGIAIALGRHAGRLESRVRRQRARDSANALDLERLTARLITAQEEERRHIARELHDQVGQVLTVVKFAIADAERTMGSSGNAASHSLEEARQVADKALDTVRNLTRLLHPSLLDDMGVAVAIDAHVKGFRRHSNVDVLAEYENVEERMAPEIELALYRTVQEALRNVARHARATACGVRLRRIGDRVDLTIEDNGVGFDAVAACQPGPERGLGLLGMQERIQQFGGQWILESSPGRGTRVFASLPAAPLVATPVLAEFATASESEGSRR